MKPTAARWWHIATVVIIVASLVTQFVLSASGENVLIDEQGRPDAAAPERILRFFSYFTVQSNILLAIGAVTLVSNVRRDGNGWRVLRLDGVLGITVTGLIFVTVLLPIVELDGLAALTNAGMHYVAPVLGLGGWLLFGPRPRVDVATVGKALIWPVAWVVYILILGELIDWYPYPFIDANEEGYGQVLGNIVVIFALGLLLLWAFQALDRRLPHTARPTAVR